MYNEKLEIILDLVNQFKSEKNKKTREDLLFTLIKFIEDSMAEYRTVEKTYIFTTEDGQTYDMSHRYTGRETVLGFGVGKTPLAALTNLLDNDKNIGNPEEYTDVKAFLIEPCFDMNGELVPVEELSLEEEGDEENPFLDSDTPLVENDDSDESRDIDEDENEIFSIIGEIPRE